MEHHDIRDVLLTAATDDERAWELLVNEDIRASPARTRAFRLNTTDTADVVQSIWLKLLEHIVSPLEAAALRGWRLSQTGQQDCVRLRRRGEHAFNLE
jgi:hypothetical protein